MDIKITNDIKLNCNTVATVLFALIIIVVPLLFLPYHYSKTTQLVLTFNFTTLALIAFLGIKIFETIKNKKYKNKKINIKLDLVDYGLIIYAILIFISSLVSKYFPYTLTTGNPGRFEGVTTLYLYITLFYISYKLFNFNVKYIPYLAISTIILSIVGILQAVIFYDTSNYRFMAYSSFGNPNFFSSYLSLMLPIYMIFYLKKNSIFYLITSIITFAALVCTKTLGGYITFTIYATIILIYSLATKVKLKNILFLILSFTLTFILLNTLSDGRYFSEGKQITEQVEIAQTNIDKVASNRGLIYKLGIEIVKENPMLGVGPDCLGAEISNNYCTRPDYTFDKIYDKAHSEYLQIAICTGLPSLIAYLTVICTIAIKLLKKFFSDTTNVVVFAIGMSIFAYLVQAAANISVTHVAPMFWIILGIGYKMSKETTLNKIKK